MNRLAFRFFRIWHKFCLGLVLILLLPHTLGAEMSAANDLSLFVRLMKQKKHLVFQVSITNKTSVSLYLAYSACPITYVVHVGNKTYTFPEKQPFVEARRCVLSLAKFRLAPKSSVVAYTAQLGDEFENTLIKARGNYSGEFRFKLSTTTSKGMFQLVYKRQQR
jgi:hypothetical protein